MMLAGVGAIVLFLTVTSYVASVNKRVAPLVTVYQAKTEIPAYSPITEDQVEAVEMPERWAPRTAIRDSAGIVGRRIGFNVTRGTLLSEDVVLPPSALNRGEREIAIKVDAVTGIAGRIRSGDFVDIYAVFGDSQRRDGLSQVLVRNVRVVSVGGVQTRSDATSRGALERRDIVPVTLALGPSDALRVTYADAFALSVRLVGLPPGIQTQDRSAEESLVRQRDVYLPQARTAGRPR
jgi:pilus assembly protein CpaB